MKTFLMLMDLSSPINHSTYKLNKKMHKAVKDIAQKVMNEASEVVFLGGTADLSIHVSCDGTWQKRGFTALNGAVACLSIDSGKVVDMEVMKVLAGLLLAHH